MPVETLTSIDPRQFFNLYPLSDAVGHRLDTKVRGAAVTNDFSGRFSVTTAEGDRITLTADIGTDFRSASYESRVETDRAAGTVEAGSTHVTFQQDLGIAVEGDLNKEELQDLTTLFQKISNIFRGFYGGQDEDARVQTADLAQGFGGLDTLSTLDLSAEVVRSVAVEVASSVTTGGAPRTAAAIPQSSNGTTAPTPSSDSTQGAPPNVPANDGPLASLIQQVLDALKEAKIDADNIRKHLPDLLVKLREDLIKELRGEAERKTDDQNSSVAKGSAEIESPASTHNLLVAYQTATSTSISLSIQA